MIEWKTAGFELREVFRSNAFSRRLSVRRTIARIRKSAERVAVLGGSWAANTSIGHALTDTMLCT